MSISKQSKKKTTDKKIIDITVLEKIKTIYLYYCLC